MNENPLAPRLRPLRAVGEPAVGEPAQQMAAFMLPLLLRPTPTSVAHMCKAHCCAAEARQPLELSFRCADWVDSFRGAERAMTVVAGDVSNGRRVGSLGLEVLPIATEGDARARQGPQPIMSGLIVEPAFRRCGIGRRLVEEAEALARSWGHDELLLYVDSTNTAAVALYEACGFRCADGTELQAVLQAADATGGAQWDVGAWLGSLGRASQPLCLCKTLGG